MRKIALFFLFAASAYGQISNPSVIYVPSAPSGSCASAPPLRVYSSGNALYICGSGGTWTALSSGSGTFTALSGDATSTSTGGATVVQGIKSVPFCTGFTPTNTQILTLTTASSPNPCWTASVPAVIPQFMPYSSCNGVATSSLTNLTFPLLGGSSTTGACTGTVGTSLGAVVQVAGTAKNLGVRCHTTGVNASSGVFTVYDQPALSNVPAATALTVTYGQSTADSIQQDLTHTVAVAVGDILSVRYTTQATETLGTCSVSFGVY